jgi:hypothetical protein
MPLCIDLFCGLGGWTEGFLAEGYRVIGFDIERHQYGEAHYPTQLVLQDVLTLHGSQFRHADMIVASPPCQAYSYRAMPWKRAKALPPPSNDLFNACFRIQAEACAAAGRHVPMVVENVKGAQPWVGRAAWHFGSFYLWGDVPAVMPRSSSKKQEKDGSWFYENYADSARLFSSHSNRRARINHALVLQGGLPRPDPAWREDGHDPPANTPSARWEYREGMRWPVPHFCDAAHHGSGSCALPEPGKGIPGARLLPRSDSRHGTIAV